VLTDARFSGVSTGACIGHIGPEALAGGPIGKILDGDRIHVVIDTVRLTGSIDLVDEQGHLDDRTLAQRPQRGDVSPDSNLPADTRLWAVLQNASGGTWGGCVYDPDAIARAIG
jgi:dihydroxyacid dehydratase/phosphogluconate dehydratase